MSLLVFDHVSFAYSPNRGALNDICFEVPEGDFVLLTGPSGAGKSTLLRLLTRLEEPCGGEIRYMGRPLSAYTPQELRTRIGMLQQTPCLGNGTIEEALLLPFTFAANRHRLPPDMASLERLFAELNLAGIPLTEQTENLSVGQKQRLCLIRCLMLEPKVLLLDEPTSALDAESRDLVRNMVEKVHTEQGITVMQIDHSGYRPSCAHIVYVVRNGLVEKSHA